MLEFLGIIVIAVVVSLAIWNLALYFFPVPVSRGQLRTYQINYRVNDGGIKSYDLVAWTSTEAKEAIDDIMKGDDDNEDLSSHIKIISITDVGLYEEDTFNV